MKNNIEDINKMALSQNTYVHMETMEETQDKDKKSVENGSSYGTSMAGWK